MKKNIILILFFVTIATAAIAATSNYSYENRMPFYGNYPQYNGKIFNMSDNYGNRPPMYGNYGNRPPKMYGNHPPRGRYGNLPPMYGNYGNRPPKMYGNHPPRGGYGMMPPRAYGFSYSNSSAE